MFDIIAMDIMRNNVDYGIYNKRREEAMDSSTNDYYEKFPSILRSRLYNGEFSFPPTTRFIYDSFNAYRCIERKKDDCSAVNREDMRSHPELGRKLPRGMSVEDPEWYSTSLSTSIDKLKHDMHLPKPDRKIALGKVYQEGGPQYMKEGNPHVSWWMYEEVDLKDFVILEDE